MSQAADALPEIPGRDEDVAKAVEALEKADRRQAPEGRRGSGGARADKGKAEDDESEDEGDEADDADDEAPESEPAPAKRRPKGKPEPDDDGDDDTGDPDDDEGAEDDETEGDDEDPPEDDSDEGDEQAGGEDDDDDALPRAKRLTREEAAKLQRRLDREATQRRAERRELRAAKADVAREKAELARQLETARSHFARSQQTEEALESLKKRFKAYDPDLFDELGVDPTELTLAFAQAGTPEGRAKALERKQAREAAEAQQRQAAEQQAAARAQHETAWFAQAAAAAAKKYPTAARLAKASPGELYRLGCMAARAFEQAGQAYDLDRLLGEVDAYMGGLAGAKGSGYNEGAHAKRKPKPGTERRESKPAKRRREPEPPPKPAKRKPGGLARRGTSDALPSRTRVEDLTDDQRVALAARKFGRLNSLPYARLH